MHVSKGWLVLVLFYGMAVSAVVWVIRNNETREMAQINDALLHSVTRNSEALASIRKADAEVQQQMMELDLKKKEIEDKLERLERREQQLRSEESQLRKAQDVVAMKCDDFWEEKERNRAAEEAAAAQRIPYNQSALWPPCLRQHDQETEQFVFMHIGKAGGTSMGGAINSAKTIDGCGVGQTCNGKKGSGCKCSGHFDFSAIKPIERAGGKHCTIAIMREPVSRFVSHFYFAQTLSWTRNLRMREESLSQFLNHEEAMVEARGLWRDGQAGVLWFAGLHTDMFVATQPNAHPKTAECARREMVLRNRTRTLEMAVENFHDSLLVVILEEVGLSFDVLKHQARLKSIEMKHSNKNSRNKETTKPNREEVKFIETLMPMDMWFYDYVRDTLHRKAEALEAYRERKRQGIEPACFDAPELLRIDRPIPHECELADCRSYPGQLHCPALNRYWNWAS